MFMKPRLFLCREFNLSDQMFYAIGIYIRCLKSLYQLII